MDQIVLPFVFIPDGQELPDLSHYRDPIILRATFEPDDHTPPPPALPTPEQGPVNGPDVAESERLRQIDPPIRAVYPEAWLLGGFAVRALGLATLRAIARRVLSPEPAGPPTAADGAAAQQRSPEAPLRPAEPISADQFHIAPGQLQRKFKHAEVFDISGNWNPENGRRFTETIRDFIRKPDVVRIEGEFRRQPVTYFFQRGTARIMMFNSKGKFISGWKLTEKQLFHLMLDGRL